MSNHVPIPTLYLFPVLDGLLIDLLKSLTDEEWRKPTIAKLWTVKDIAAHLLDGNLRVISSAHHYSGKPPQNINSYRDLVNYLNHLNAVFVEAMDRVSPQQLISMLADTGEQYTAYFSSLDPFAPAQYAVSWAGEEQSVNWFHTAREYTEKWHHQQQIRHAVNKPGIITPELFYPCMDTFMRGIPYNYREVEADAGTTVAITISTEAGGTWYLQKASNNWQLIKQTATTHDASVTIDPDTAWQFFTKGITPVAAEGKAIVTGDFSLTKNIFSTLSVMA
ncbi:maleylpyruvate isomerase family mycothiol-dependent enzyme [Mucilaginibacter gynuensis]|uniref:Maleylpyruvate isomerase family mycothiol-dependent enzyme n=1 Tax=Mucilaginibacter gynuensis TaxID=1302236 RepID=A0ABP8FND6_9SPHI